MQEVTGDLKQTQGFLGHSSIGITSDVYVHLQPDSTVESMKKMEEKFSANCAQLCSKRGLKGSQGRLARRNFL